MIIMGENFPAMEVSDKLFEKFLNYISERDLIKPNQRVLLAVSGGIDSAVLTRLFKSSPFRFAMAHCNFKLRGRASDKDQDLVAKMAGNAGVDFFCEQFDTKEYARMEKVSIQVAARDLRYQWLEKVRRLNGFDLIATAHHLDDNIETLLLNLTRGTGLSGLKGIPGKNGHIIRPLLFASREEIAAYATLYKIPFRNDRSNASDKYTRNKIRHHVVPVLREINPSLHNSLKQYFDNMESILRLYHYALDHFRDNLVKHTTGEVEIMIEPLLEIPGFDSLLYEFLKVYGFSPKVSSSIAACLEKPAGRVFYSDTHTAVKDRSLLFVFPSVQLPAGSSISIGIKTGKCRTDKYFFLFEHFKVPENGIQAWPENEHEALIDEDLLEFPLLLRPWKNGDSMIPIGMSGKKKISDILTDAKIPLHRKKNIFVLESQGKIAWIPGLKCSQEFRITHHTKNIFKASMYNNSQND